MGPEYFIKRNYHVGKFLISSGKINPKKFLPQKLEKWEKFIGK